jgi:hypothetical protein
MRYACSMPRAMFDEVKGQAIADTKRQTFAGADAAMSDLLSAELQAAIERRYGMMQSHLDKVRKARRDFKNKARRPGRSVGSGNPSETGGFTPPSSACLPCPGTSATTCGRT